MSLDNMQVVEENELLSGVKKDIRHYSDPIKARQASKENIERAWQKFLEPLKQSFAEVKEEVVQDDQTKEIYNKIQSTVMNRLSEIIKVDPIEHVFGENGPTPMVEQSAIKIKPNMHNQIIENSKNAYSNIDVEKISSDNAEIIAKEINEAMIPVEEPLTQKDINQVVQQEIAQPDSIVEVTAADVDKVVENKEMEKEEVNDYQPISEEEIEESQETVWPTEEVKEQPVFTEPEPVSVAPEQPAEEEETEEANMFAINIEPEVGNLRFQEIMESYSKAEEENNESLTKVAAKEEERKLLKESLKESEKVLQQKYKELEEKIQKMNELTNANNMKLAELDSDIEKDNKRLLENQEQESQISSILHR